MSRPDLTADLPDPADRSAAWHGDVPAYLAWRVALRDVEGLTAWQLVREYQLIRNYAEAVPNTAALNALCQLGPLLEIGAGTGYWARLLQDRGVDVLPVDVGADHRRSWGLGESPWTDLVEADHRAVAVHTARVPFVCWPPRPRGFMPELLQLATQDTLALVTDGPAPFPEHADPLYSALEAGGWTRALRQALPSWPGRYDHLAIWKR